MWFNLRHLRDANYNYWRHFAIAASEAAFCFGIAVLSLIHAVFPFLFDFNLIKWRVERLQYLKELFPNDPELNKIKSKNDI
jgi:hypothetical protein